jgi:hypothetical protein
MTFAGFEFQNKAMIENQLGGIRALGKGGCV